MLLHQWKDVDNRGNVERIDYFVQDSEGNKIAKYANVYLPYGYSAEKKYNVLYMMHGGGGNPDAWLDCSQIKNVFDQLFAEQKAEPFIAVFPTYYNVKPGENRKKGVPADWERQQTLFFQKELREKLIPLIDTKYSTYAESTTEEAAKKARTHRAFCGFSMGGSTTWYAFLENLDVISDFIPLSGDCWVLEQMGGRTKSKETAEYLHDFILKSGYTKEQFRIFAATGTKDIAYPNLTPMLDAMKNYPDTFEFSDDLSAGNVHYLLKEDAPHAYEEVYHHVYNYAPYLFQCR